MDQSIPNISYHLVFCFLNFKEISMVNKCSHKWRQLIMDTSFVKMFDKKETLLIKYPDNEISSTSPLVHFLQNIQLYYFSSIIDTVQSLHFLPQLSSLSILFVESVIDDLPLKKAFRSLSNKLTKLEVKPLAKGGYLPVPLLFSFHSPFQYLTSLTYLSIHESSFDQKYNFSFLHYMEELKTFKFIGAKYYIDSAFISAIRSLPSLVDLELSDISEKLIQELCLQPGAPKHLIKISSFADMSIVDQVLCCDHLKKLGAFEGIEYRIYSPFVADYLQFPHSLGDFIIKLRIVERKLTKQLVKAILSLKKLKSLQLSHCQMKKKKLNRLIIELSGRLEELQISGEIPELSPDALSACSKVKSLKMNSKNNEII
jgi:hypothetical protein